MRAPWPSFFLAIALICQVMTAAADPVPSRTPNDGEQSIVAQLEAVWRDWAARNPEAETALAIGHDGAVIWRDGIRRKPDHRANLASLSKSIIAVCMGEMLNAQQLPFDTPLVDLRRALDRIDLNLPAYAERMTIAHLITHSSGMNPDTTQTDRSLRRGGASEEPADRAYAKRALVENAVAGRRGQHFYNNGNYAMLGVLMAGLQDDLEYETDCRRDVLIPAGADEVSYEGRWGGLGAWGGWYGSAEEYLKFALSYFSADSPLAREPRNAAWSDVSPSEGYGMGMSYYGEAAPYFIYHHGTICTHDGIDNTSTIFFVTRSGWSISFNASMCLDEDQAILHELFVEAAK